MNLEDLEDPYLLEPINLEPQTLMKHKSELLFLMLFTDASNATEEKDPQMMKTLEMKETSLLMMSPIEQVSRTMSPSLKPKTLSQWDHSHASLIMTKLEQRHFSPSTSDTLC